MVIMDSAIASWSSFFQLESLLESLHARAKLPTLFLAHCCENSGLVLVLGFYSESLCDKSLREIAIL